MPEDRWTKVESDGTETEYCYNESEAGAWATRKRGEVGVGESISPAPRGLTRHEVEELFQ
jgi:hypothetical protein